MCECACRCVCVSVVTLTRPCCPSGEGRRQDRLGSGCGQPLRQPEGQDHRESGAGLLVPEPAGPDGIRLPHRAGDAPGAQPQTIAHRRVCRL